MAAPRKSAAHPAVQRAILASHVRPKAPRVASQPEFTPAAAMPDSGPASIEPGTPAAARAASIGREDLVASLPALPKLPRAPRKPKPVRPCECGCGGSTKSRFVPGHDGRLHGWVLRVERGVVKLADIQPEGVQIAVAAALRAKQVAK